MNRNNSQHLGSVFLQAATADKATSKQPERVEYAVVACMMDCADCQQVTPHEHLGQGWSCAYCGTITKAS